MANLAEEKTQSNKLQAAHTPGPWITDYMERECWIGSDPIQDLVCSVERIGPKSEYLANARLIAAAPELLEALQGVLRVADRKTTEFDAARAAIKKAGGQ